MSDKIQLIYTPDEIYVSELMHKKHDLKKKFEDAFYSDDRVYRNEILKEYMATSKKLDQFFGSLKKN